MESATLTPVAPLRGPENGTEGQDAWPDLSYDPSPSGEAGRLHELAPVTPSANEIEPSKVVDLLPNAGGPAQESFQRFLTAGAMF